VPALLAGLSPTSLVRSLADELREGAGDEARARSRMLPQADQILATLACHCSRRAGEVLPAGEQRAILEALDTIPWAPTCPHGRPVAVPLERGEIERRFGRR
jgi:DNA mismatch repair protein MutL